MKCVSGEDAGEYRTLTRFSIVPRYPSGDYPSDRKVSNFYPHAINSGISILVHGRRHNFTVVIVSPKAREARKARVARKHVPIITSRAVGASRLQHNATRSFQHDGCCTHPPIPMRLPPALPPPGTLELINWPARNPSVPSAHTRSSSSLKRSRASPRARRRCSSSRARRPPAA